MASGQVITDLFQQIVHSEEKIKQRFEDLKKGDLIIILQLLEIDYFLYNVKIVKLKA